MDWKFSWLNYVSWPGDIIVEGRSGLSGADNPAATKLSRPRTRCDSRSAMVYRGSQLAFGLGGTHMLSLGGYRRDVSIT